MKLGRFARTLRYVTPAQVGWRVVHETRLRLYRSVPAVWWSADADARVATLPVQLAPAERDAELAARWREGRVRYLAEEGDRSDWVNAGRSKLWRYERQYHRELVALAMTGAVDDARAMAKSWIDACPPAGGDAWEPYPVARRLLNWSVAVTVAPALGPTLAPHLALQLRFLAAHLERHLLGNHLLCDVCALVAGAAVLEGERASAIGASALRLLDRELGRQLLADGGYAERTVHYHALVWHDATVACRLAAARGVEVPPAIGDALSRMEDWLRQVRRSDGSWPALNDAVFPLDCAAPAAAATRADVELADTGWSLVRSGDDELLFEHGELGPPEQPGHGHSDALSYELVWGGRPIVVDTGVTTYDTGAIRTYERSARAHATVTVDGEGPDELWAAFRVGARGRCEAAPIQRDGEVRILRGSVAAPGGWRHERAIAYRPGLALVVVDRVTGQSLGAPVISRVPLDPDCALDGTLVRAPGASLELTTLRGHRGPIEEGWVSGGFGVRRPRTVATFEADAHGRCAYAIASPSAKGVVQALFATVE